MKDAVTLQAITENNIRDVIRLEDASDQRKFVASNVITMAFTYVDPYIPYAICVGEQVVGPVAIEMIPALSIPSTTP